MDDNIQESVTPDIMDNPTGTIPVVENRPSNRKIGWLIATLSILVIAIFVQVIGTYMVNKNIETAYKHKTDDITKEIDVLLASDQPMLTILKGLNNIATDNQKIKNEMQAYIANYSWVLIRNAGLLDQTTETEKQLAQLTAKNDELISAIQRNEQVDKDLIALMSSQTATWGTTMNRCETLIGENASIKSAVVKIVVPPELKKYQQSFMEGLTEKEQFLHCFNDYLTSSLQSEANLESAMETYYSAVYYWEYSKAYDYAIESQEYEYQATAQMEEAMYHWDNYKSLKEKLYTEGDELTV